MSQSFLVLLAIAAGALIPAQSSLNSVLGRTLGHPLWATGAVFLVGSVAWMLAYAAMRPANPTWAATAAVPTYAWLGGLLAMAYVVLVVIVMPRLGAGLTTALILLGQMVTALTLDHFGLLGNVVHPMDWHRTLGLACIVGGVYFLRAY